VCGGKKEAGWINRLMVVGKKRQARVARTLPEKATLSQNRLPLDQKLKRATGEQTDYLLYPGKSILLGVYATERHKGTNISPGKPIP
jgi:hypothetical protein